ncbi:hypothetical protein RB653_008525 [Dictyostelium firmibasis]|uniref:Essential for reactive oxygen species protein n=1 Tax=Dictyostelium firmibasis TaxID=79012 RepID=A0AAN7U4V3_9MYCE
MKIIKTTSNELIIIHSNRLKEWSMGLAIASIGFLPSILHTSDELFIKVSKVVFVVTFILIGLLGIHEEYHIEFNIKKRKMIMEYRNIIDVITMQPGRKMILELDQINGAIVQHIKEEKKPLYKLAIDYSDGLKIGVTETCYFFPDQITDTKNSINKWLADNGIISNKKVNGAQNNNNNYSDDDDEEEEEEEEEENGKEKEKVQSIKKRINKVK